MEISALNRLDLALEQMEALGVAVHEAEARQRRCEGARRLWRLILTNRMYAGMGLNPLNRGRDGRRPQATMRAYLTSTTLAGASP